MAKTFRDIDRLVLERLIHDNSGEIKREDVVQAFKRAGARVGKISGRLHVVFGTRQLPLCSGFVHLNTPHKTFREAIRGLSRDVLFYQKLQSEGKIPRGCKKHLGTSVNVNMPECLHLGLKVH